MNCLELNTDLSMVTGHLSLAIGREALPSSDFYNRQLPVTSYQLPVPRRWFKVPMCVPNWKWTLSMISWVLPFLILSRGSAQPFLLPTANHALFEPGGEERY